VRWPHQEQDGCVRSVPDPKIKAAFLWNTAAAAASVPDDDDDDDDGDDGNRMLTYIIQFSFISRRPCLPHYWADIVIGAGVEWTTVIIWRSITGGRIIAHRLLSHYAAI